MPVLGLALVAATALMPGAPIAHATNQIGAHVSTFVMAVPHVSTFVMAVPLVSTFVMAVPHVSTFVMAVPHVSTFVMAVPTADGDAGGRNPNPNCYGRA